MMRQQRGAPCFEREIGIDKTDAALADRIFAIRRCGIAAFDDRVIAACVAAPLVGFAALADSAVKAAAKTIPPLRMIFSLRAAPRSR